MIESRPSIDVSTTAISWHVVLQIRPDRLDDFRKLTREMVESTRNEPGAICFERFIDDDRTTVHIYERYRNSQAAIAHLQEFGRRFSERFSDLVEREQFTVFGSPSHELKELLDAYKPTYADWLDGFSLA